MRDYGLGDAGRIAGRPRAVKLDDKTMEQVIEDGGCPNCGCYDIMEITVEVHNEMLKGGSGIGKYLGCPACPWATPMVVVAKGGMIGFDVVIDRKGSGEG